MRAKEFFATIALEETGQEEISREISEATGLEKCIKLLAQTAARNAKFLSSQLKEELFYAMIASGQRKETEKKQTSKRPISLVFVFEFLINFLNQTYF